MDKLARQFLARVPLKNMDWDAIGDLSETQQEMLLMKTVDHPTVLRFPVEYSYQTSFIKRLIDCLIEHESEIIDDIYDRICLLDNSSRQSSEYSYKHYAFDSSLELITLKESCNLISGGTTGLHTWEASLCLSEWCLQNRNILKGKNIIELGSGVGLTSIVVSKFCEPNKIISTDCHPEVLNILSENVKCNCLISKNIEVLPFEWDDVNDKEVTKNIPSIDFVLAADVVYDPSIYDSLSSAFLYFLKANKGCSVYLACTVRNENTIDNFLRLINENKMNATKLDFVSTSTVHNITNVDIYNITFCR